MEGLIAAVLSVLTVWTAPSGPVHVAHCRRRPGGCEAYVATQVTYASAAAEAWELDPKLLLSVAIRESGLNEDTIGEHGEATAYQLHPKGAGARARRMHRDHGGPLGYCAAFVAAQELHRGFVACGNWPGALAYYNSGRCRVSGYSERVMKAWGEL